MDLGQTIIVYGAGIIGAITSFPQLYQIIKTKKVRDLNPYFFILHTISDILYVIYGILEEDYILSISVSMPATCNFIIFVLWLFYIEKDEEINDMKNILSEEVNKIEEMDNEVIQIEQIEHDHNDQV